MENNWREQCIRTYGKNVGIFPSDEDLKAMLEFGNLVFEATKKEVANKAKSVLIPPSGCNNGAEGYYYSEVDKESILNINKPNL